MGYRGQDVPSAQGDRGRQQPWQPSSGTTPGGAGDARDDGSRGYRGNDGGYGYGPDGYGPDGYGPDGGYPGQGQQGQAPQGGQYGDPYAQGPYGGYRPEEGQGGYGGAPQGYARNASGYDQPAGYGQPRGYDDRSAPGYGSGGYPGPAGGYQDPGSGYGRSGGYPAATPPGDGYASRPGGGSGAYPIRQDSGAYPAQPGGTDRYPAADAGNDWYGGQPAAAKGASFADTGTYALNGRVIDEYGTGPQGTMRDPVRGYPPGPGQRGSGPVPSSPAPRLALPASPATAPSVAETRQQARLDEPPTRAGRAPTGSFRGVASGEFQQAPSGGPATGGFTRSPTGGFSESPTGGFARSATGGFGGAPAGGAREPATGGFSGAPAGGARGPATGGFGGSPTGGFTRSATGGFGGAPAGGARGPATGDFPGSPGRDTFAGPGGVGPGGYDNYQDDEFNEAGDPYQDPGDGPARSRSSGGDGRESGKPGHGGSHRGGKRLLFAALAVVAVGIIGAAAYVFVLQPSSPARNNAAATGPLPTGSAQPSMQACQQALGTYCHISTSADDPKPLTAAELYPPAVTDEKDKTSYSLVSTKVDTKCASAVIGANLIKALQAGKCTQVVRGSYVSSDNRIMGTIGVVNLDSTNEAHYAGRVVGENDFVAPLTSAKGVASKLGNGEGVVEAEFKGHYLILTWSEYVNGTAPTTKAQDAQLEQFSNDLVNDTANVALTQRMVTGTPATS